MNDDWFKKTNEFENSLNVKSHVFQSEFDSCQRQIIDSFEPSCFSKLIARRASYIKLGILGRLARKNGCLWMPHIFWGKGNY